MAGSRQTYLNSRNYVVAMPTKRIPSLTAAEFATLSAVDGTRKQPKLSAKITARLRDLGLIERREWPNGPLWRTARGERWVREGKSSN
jgi:hypothetical protein